jgi:MYXO-CTERM domain-containing protein
VPGLLSLGEALVLDDDGAVAVWGPSGLSIDEQAQALARHAFEGALSGGDVRLGDALLAALATIVEGDGREDMPSIYHLFGDPALRVSKANSTPDPGTPETPGPSPGDPDSPSLQGSGGCSVRTGGVDLSVFAWVVLSALLLYRRRRR